MFLHFSGCSAGRGRTRLNELKQQVNQTINTPTEQLSVPAAQRSRFAVFFFSFCVFINYLSLLFFGHLKTSAGSLGVEDGRVSLFSDSL